MNTARLPVFAAVAIGMAIASILVATHPANALCAASALANNAQSMLRGMGPGRVMFVGSVAETRAAGYNALFHVEQVWYGAPLNEWMTLRGSNDESWLAVEENIPRWQVGERYLVDAKRDGADLRSTPCSFPLRWQESFNQTGRVVETHAVASWRPVLWPWRPLIGTLFIPMSAILAAVTAALVVFVLSRRRRTPELEGSAR
jgi:hypothetical protein